jgi:hypothetical protein
MDKNDWTLRERVVSRLLYIWRLAFPFWLFRDAQKGSPEQRIANYRYNRSRRKLLPFYVWKWIGIALCLLHITRLLSDLMPTTAAESADHLCVALFCMSAGIGFAFSCVVVTTLFTAYLYLSCVER